MENYIINNLLDRYKNTVIRGIDNITNASVQSFDNVMTSPTGELEKKTNYKIMLEGFDIENLIGMIDRLDIDENNIYSMSVMDTLEIFGVEAARNRIIERLATSLGSKEPANAHLLLYADSLTRTGDFVPIERLVRKEKNRTLSTVAASSAGKSFMNAAITGISESNSTIAGSILLGSVPPIGTNYSKIIINEEFVVRETKGAQDIIDDL